MCLNTDLLSVIWESTDWENFDAKYFELHSNKAYFLYDIIKSLKRYEELTYSLCKNNWNKQNLNGSHN